MRFPRFDTELDRAIPYAVFVASVVLALADVVAGVVLDVTDVSLVRVGFALATGLAAYRESRRSRPRVLPLVAGAVGVTAVGSILSVAAVLPFGWYDEYTTYSILVALSIAGATVQHRSTWTSWIWPTTAGAWAFTYGLLMGRSLSASIDWMIVSAATVAVLYYMVGTLVRTATDALDTQEELTELQEALTRCSQLLLEDASDSSMDRALRALLSATEADYACVDVTIPGDSGPPQFEVVAEASVRPVRPEHNWVKGTYADLPTILAAHQAGRVCAVDVAELSGRERELYESDNIGSELSVPIIVDGTWRGSLAFATLGRSRQWSDLEIHFLMQAAGLVAAYWRRRDDHERLADLVRSKDELVASVSHELRTPLTGVVGLAEEMAAAADQMDPGTIAELAGLVADQSRELAYLVEDLLVAARVESGALTIHPAAVNLRQEAGYVVTAVLGEGEASVEGWEGEVWIDPVRCRQILRNLLTNAQRYGGDRVEVTVARDDSAAVLVVRDDGSGVPADDVERIFQPYQRSHQVAPGSIGVGLAVSRNLARLMGGTLEYRRVDGWTEFVLSIPDPVQGPAVSGRLAAAFR